MTSYSMAGLFNSDPGMSKHWISFCTANRGLIHTRLDNRRQHADDQQHSGFPNMQTLSRNRAKKEWREVPCTRLDRGLTPFPSLRARSVPIIPSLQGNDSAEGCVEQSKQGVLQEGSFPKPGHSFISSSEIVLESEARPSHVCPHSIVSAPGSEKSHCHIGQGSCETSVGSGRMLQQSSLVASLTAAFGSGVVRLNSTNTAIAVTMLESEGKSMQYIDRLLYSCPGSRGPQAGVHTHAQELGKQHSPLIDGVANCFLSRVAVRSAGTACVKTADS
ncbi:hypothetical protein UPYG_G00143610 [Umbra pygmaea]|uniref:Uncharacterized protein n=1 Tax=Umbra pygmaea TaxID=75934 RepID=A0ABD0X092_UMBPY